MSRDRANINTDIWRDEDFCLLSPNAQFLYLQLLTSATLSYAGVADWRPKRIAALSAGRTVAEVDAAGKELEQGHYIIIDEDTEEAVVRSFLRWDGLMQKPNVAKAMVTAWKRIYSKPLQGVVVHELLRLRERFPDWRGFAVETVQEMLRNPSVNPFELVSERDAPLLTTNYQLPTTDDVPPAIENRGIEHAFEQAYGRWPKKTERKRSFEKFKQLAKKMPAEELVAHIVKFGDAYKAAGEPLQFVPALVVWLNGERWTDALPQPRAAAGGRPTRLEENLAEYNRLYGGDTNGRTGSVPALDPGFGA